MTFGALSPSGAVGAKPVNSLGLEVDLTGTPTLASGSAGAYSASCATGRLVFTGAAGAPNASVWTCTLAAGGTVDLTVSSLADTRTIGSEAELTTFLNLSNAAVGSGGKSGLTGIVRYGTYTGVLIAAWNAKFENLSAPCIIKGERASLRPVMGRVGAYSTTATGLTQGNLTLQDLELYAEATTGNKRVTDAVGTVDIVATNVTNPTANVTVERCHVWGNAPVARLAGLRPAQVLVGVNLSRGTGMIVKDCEFAYLSVGVIVSSDSTTVENNDFHHMFDDAIRVAPVTTNAVVDSVTIKNNRIRDFIGDHGSHPDLIHVFAGTGGTGVTNLLIEGNVFWPGTESALCPGWPTDVGGGAYTRDAALTAASFSLTSADSDRFIFVDAATPRTVTLTDPAAPGANFDVLVQTWGAGTVTIDPDGFEVYDADNAVTITDPLTFVAPWATVQIRLDAALNRWTLHRYGAAYQGFFSNSITDGIDDATIRFNLFWLNGNPFRLDGTNSTGADFIQNTVLPIWPGDLDGDGTPNSPFEYGPAEGARSLICAGTGHVASGNIVASVSGVTADSGGDVLDADGDFNTSIAAQNAAFQTPNGSTVFPSSLSQAVTYARPRDWTAVRSGMGAGLAPDAADDYWNFGQHDEPLGLRSSAPWFVRNLSVGAIGGGFYATWLAPGYGTTTSYDCEYRINGGSWTGATEVGTTSTVESAAISDVIDVRVRAVNGSGNGPWVQAPSVTVTSAAAVIPTLSLLGTPTTISGGNGGDDSRYESYTFTPSGDHPLLIFVHHRTDNAVDPGDSFTIGTPGRTWGTGTAPDLIRTERIDRANVWALWVSSPGTAALSLQYDSGDSGGNGHRVQVYEAQGATGFGATAGSAGTGTSRSVTLNTTAVKSLAVTAVTTATNTAITQGTGTELYDVNINAVTQCHASHQDANTIGAYTCSASWTGSVGNALIAVEVLG